MQKEYYTIKYGYIYYTAGIKCKLDRLNLTQGSRSIMDYLVQTFGTADIARDNCHYDKNAKAALDILANYPRK